MLSSMHVIMQATVSKNLVPNNGSDHNQYPEEGSSGNDIIYPNPSNGTFTLKDYKLENVQMIELFSLTGANKPIEAIQTIDGIQVHAQNSQDNGLFILRIIKKNGKSSIAKLIIQP